MTIPILHATAETFDALVLTPTNELVIAYFWGTNCPNCEIFAAHLPSLLEALGDVRARLVKVDAYTETELARRFGIYGIPAFFLFRDGKKLGRMSEFRGRTFFLDVLRENLPSA
jgi:thioredoxin 1